MLHKQKEFSCSSCKPSKTIIICHFFFLKKLFSTYIFLDYEINTNEHFLVPEVWKCIPSVFGYFQKYFFKKMLLLFNYSCMPFLPIPPPYPQKYFLKVFIFFKIVSTKKKREKKRMKEVDEVTT